MKLNLLVIRTNNPEELKEQYEFLDFHFVRHQHGNGPFHYASETEDFVFEIYPLLPSMKQADASIRLGFAIENLDQKMKMLKDTTWKIATPMSQTEWGPIAVIQDLDGRKIELKEL